MARDNLQGPLSGKRIVFGFGGGIAAYKACHALRLFVHEGAEVRAAMTPAATKFVTPLTVQALSGGPVLTEVLEPSQEAQYGHLDLVRGADLVVLAPATANLIGQIRAGLASDAVTTTVIAARCPVLLAPAMNVAMWANEQVQENVAALKQVGRYHFVGPASGLLADGDVGAGRLSEPEEILAAAKALFAPPDLAGRHVVITAGPTREFLDPVRFLSNPSTGRMGYAIAAAARARGARVTLVSGPVELAPPAGVELVRVTSAEEMLQATMQVALAADAFVASAAVADQRPVARAPQKVKKQPGTETLVLERTPDILATVSQQVQGRAQRPVLVGFAAETERVEEHAREKLQRKGLDFVVANDVSAPGSGFGTETNEVLLVSASGTVRLPMQAKRDVAGAVLDRVVAMLRAR